MRKRSQAGFTLVEIMIASTASMLVLIPALSMMLRAFDWYREVESALALNRQARQAFDLLGNGAKLTVNGNDATPYLYGVHGRHQKPSGPQRSQYVLKYQSNNLIVSGDSLASMSVRCTGVAKPLPDCANASETKTLEGWMGNDVRLIDNDRTIADRTVEVTVTVTHPYQAQRLVNSADATETYRTIFTLNRDENDP